MDSDPIPTKERILKAACDLSDERSIQFIQLVDVARAAGVSSSLVAFHFKTREDLLIEARLKRWEELGAVEFEAWLAAHPEPTISDLMAECLKRDLEEGHRSRDFMAMAWWWSQSDEARFQALCALRAEPMRHAIQRESGCADEALIKGALDLIRLAYVGLLREALLQGLSPKEASAQMMRLVLPVLQSLGAGRANESGG